MTLLSPQRRKGNAPSSSAIENGVSIPAVESSSPRNGSDNKRARRSEARHAITDNPLWGRCTLDEFAEFSVGDHFIIIVPSDHKPDSKHAISQRRSVKERIVAAVVASSLDDSDATINKAPHRRLSDTVRKQNAHDEIKNNHGIDRNQKVYFELRCAIQSYPHRDDFVNNTMGSKDIHRLFRQNEGVYFSLLDYHNEVVHIRWNELPFIQIWQPYFRNDHRPPITIKCDRGSENYVRELITNFNTFKDDNQRMCELLLVHEQKKNNSLTSTIRQMQTLHNATSLQWQQFNSDAIATSFRDEMNDHRLPTFVAFVDQCYRNGWEQHYTNFNPNTPLLDSATLLHFHQMIETNFPTHFTSLKSIIYAKRANEPARAKTQYNLDKRHILVHYFFCLLREQNRHHLIHWAIVSTIALHYRGADANTYRNSHGRAFTIDLPLALDKLDEIFTSTTERRMTVLANQRFVNHVLDNYNRFQRFSTQRYAKSGVFHNAIVHSAIRVNEFNKPQGTILVNTSGESWKVVSSSLSSNFAVNTVVAEKVNKDDGHAFDRGEPTGVYCSIRLPSNSWRVVLMPGVSERVDITYFMQAIPSSLRMKVPQTLSDKEFIMGDRTWMAKHFAPSGPYRTLGVREYTELVHVANSMHDILAAVEHRIMLDMTGSGYHAYIDVKKCKAMVDLLGNEYKTIHTSIREFQRNCLEFFNESYYSVGEYIWMPLCAKDEMCKAELYLAAIEVFERLRFMDTTGDESTILDGCAWRRIFQYGDVLTIQKLHQLNPSVLKQMTHIGKDNNAEKIYRLLTESSLRSHDYLHENIHRLQAIFKVYFPGFIDVCCSVIGTKRVGEDPTKGRWRDHEVMALKIADALKILRFNVFLSSTDNSEEETKSETIWKIGSQYRQYCELLLISPNENTKFVARFINMMDSWKVCRDAVRLGDWATMEMAAIHWMPVWGELKKPLYLMESMRRLESVYSYSNEELEYHRMNRFFRMHFNGNCMSYDDFCEKHNYAMKQLMNHPDIDVMTKKSHHLHAASRCAKLVFGYEGKSRSSTPDTGEDVEALYRFFVKCNVFAENDAERTLDRRLFGNNFSEASFDDCAGRQRIENRRKRPQTEQEKRDLFAFQSDDENSVPGHDGGENDDVDENIDGDVDDLMSVNSTVSEVDSTASETNIGKWPPMNKKGVRDLFSVETHRFKSAVAKRLNTIGTERKYEKTITDSRNYFQAKMERQMQLLKNQRNLRSERIAREELPYERLVRLSRIQYMGGEELPYERLVRLSRI